jgi:Mlc titration factor MtfA (ptsG expression regulator)
MLLSWLRNRRRQRLLATPFPPEWAGYLERNVAMYARLTPIDRAMLCDIARVLVAEKNWEGCGGLTMTDEVKVTVAAQAARLLLGLRHDHFARVQSILVYPAGFRSPDGWRTESGVIDNEVGTLGEAWYDGPVVLAWDAVLSGGQDPDDGRNLVLHEFAHQLDYLDGMADGTPPLRRRQDYARWQEVMSYEFARLKAEGELGTPKVLDVYGATNHAEFFAVSTEAFFEKPVELRERHPDLYGVLRDYYGQEPAEPDRPSLITEGAKPKRASRKAAKVPAHEATTAEWPGWVRFWEIHPGVARVQALVPQEHHLTAVVSGVVVFGICLWWSSANEWKLSYGLFAAPLFVLVMGVLWVWLRLAVWWVDRNGTWGGGMANRRREPPGSDTPAGEPNPGG